MRAIKQLKVVCSLLLVVTVDADYCGYKSQGNWPDPGSLRAKMVATTEYGNLPVLANVASYFILPRTDKSPGGYLPLELRQVNAMREAGIQMIFDCAAYSLSVYNTRYQEYDALGSLTVEIPSGAPGNNSEAIKLTCHNSKLNMLYEKVKRFSCLGRLAFSCYQQNEHDPDRRGYDELVGYAVFETLEFELDGNRDNMDAGRFTREPDLMSCNPGDKVHQKVSSDDD